MHGLIVLKYSDDFQYYYYDYMLKNTHKTVRRLAQSYVIISGIMCMINYYTFMMAYDSSVTVVLLH